jgi:hypothetical protein
MSRSSRWIRNFALDPEGRFFTKSATLDKRDQDILPNRAHFGTTKLLNPSHRKQIAVGVDMALEWSLCCCASRITLQPLGSDSTSRGNVRTMITHRTKESHTACYRDLMVAIVDRRSTVEV